MGIGERSIHFFVLPDQKNSLNITGFHDRLALAPHFGADYGRDQGASARS
jgi:hypothetical protein